jgi:hypothetical protein
MGLPEHPDEPKIVEYRRKAIEAAILAGKSKDEFMRIAWLNIAASYQDMADRLERKFKL